MRLLTLWGERRGMEGAAPELMVAWDEYCADANYDGFVQECDKARASWGSDLVQYRMIEVEVSEAALRKAFAPVVVSGEVQES